MRKVFLIFTLLFITIHIYSQVSIPTFTNYKETISDKYTDEKFYTYVTNSGQNIYKVFYLVNEEETKYSLNFHNKSLVTGIEIIVIINFTNKNSMYNYTGLMEDNMELSFLKIRRDLDWEGVKPIYCYDDDNFITKVFYEVDSDI